MNAVILGMKVISPQTENVRAQTSFPQCGIIIHGGKVAARGVICMETFKDCIWLANMVFPTDVLGPQYWSQQGWSDDVDVGYDIYADNSKPGTPMLTLMKGAGWLYTDF
eukprot:4137530-Ditylum_brightwellii.AAC.1